MRKILTIVVAMFLSHGSTLALAEGLAADGGAERGGD